jgi:hypothetical protein
MGRGASRLKPKRPNGDYQASSPIHPSQKKTIPLTDPVLGDTCITCIAKMSSKNKNWRLYLVIFGYIYRNLVQLRLILAPIFGLGVSGAFLVFFFGEVSDKGKRIPLRPAAGWRGNWHNRLAARTSRAFSQNNDCPMRSVSHFWMGLSTDFLGF